MVWKQSQVKCKYCFGVVFATTHVLVGGSNLPSYVTILDISWLKTIIIHSSIHNCADRINGIVLSETF